MAHNLALQVIPDKYAVCKLPPDAEIPAAIRDEAIFSVTRTPDELSLVVCEEKVQPGWQAEPGWRMMKVMGPLDFNLVGVLMQIVEPLARAHISVFVISTYETDYVMVRASMLGAAVASLRASGIEVSWGE